MVWWFFWTSWRRLVLQGTFDFRGKKRTEGLEKKGGKLKLYKIEPGVETS
jgi:hypothetical protein